MENQAYIAVSNLLHGIAPERSTDIKFLFNKYQPKFSVVEETDSNGMPAFTLRAGLYTKVEFNHRAMLCFWLGAHVVWEAYSEYAYAVNNGRSFNQERLTFLLSSFKNALLADDVTNIEWPKDVLRPGNYGSDNDNPEKIMPAKLATFATGWALLHEMRHIQKQQEGTSSTIGDVASCHAEELECDSFAAKFILEKTPEYSRETNYDLHLVQMQRKLGILFGVFTIGLLSRQPKKASATHPSIELRLKTMLSQLKVSENDAVGMIIKLVSLGLEEGGALSVQPFS